MATSQTLHFATGMDEAEAIYGSGGGDYSRTHYLNIKDGESEPLRFLMGMEHLITVQRHNSAPTRPQPNGWKGNWPKSMPSVCRQDPAFVRAGTYEDCFCCNELERTQDKRAWGRSARTFGYAVAREKIIENGRMVGTRDVMVESEVAGAKVLRPKIYLLCYSRYNFWDGVGAMAQELGSIVNRDITIRRMGSDQNTAYTPIPWEPVNTDGKPLSQGGVQLDMAQADHLRPYVEALGGDTTIEPIHALGALLHATIIEQSSDDRFHLFYDTRFPQPERKRSDDDKDAHQGQQQQKVEQAELSAAALDALRQRVQGVTLPQQKEESIGFG